MGHAAFPGPLLSNRAGYLYTQQSSHLVEVFLGHPCFRQAEQHLLLLQPPAQQVRPSHWQGSSGSHHQTIIHGPNHRPGKEVEGWRQSQTHAFSPALFSWVFNRPNRLCESRNLYCMGDNRGWQEYVPGYKKFVFSSSQGRYWRANRAFLAMNECTG